MSKSSTALRYVGPKILDGHGVPLPQGWPALDHDEPDEALAKEKLASKMYAPAVPVAAVARESGAD